MENKTEKVLFIGLPSTGKTTLINTMHSLETTGAKYYYFFDTDVLYFMNDDRKANKLLTLMLLSNVFKQDRSMGDGSGTNVNYLLASNYYDEETIIQMIESYRPTKVYFATYDSHEDYFKAVNQRANHYTVNETKAKEQWLKFEEMTNSIHENEDLKQKYGFKFIKMIQSDDSDRRVRNIKMLAQQLMD